MILKLCWKDPDFSCRDVVARKDISSNDLPEHIQTLLDKFGLGEYIVVLVDTDSGEVQVVPRDRVVI